MAEHKKPAMMLEKEQPSPDPAYHPSLHPPKADAPKTFGQKLAVVLEMIKFRHSVFALPFALASMLVAAHGLPPLSVFFWIIIACVAARSMAMGFNRLVDQALDARNPRTQNRALPAGLISARFTGAFVVVCAVIFMAASAMLNRFCFFLSPLAIAVLLGYSYCKRFTESVHLVLGLALGIAPLGAWVAVTGSLESVPIFLGLGVLFWTAGFDIIYSCLDVEVDRRERLHSLPARLGVVRALRLARWFHVLAAICMALFIIEMGLGLWSWIAMVIVCLLLVGEHRLVRPHDLSRVGPAFFTINAWVSIVFLAGCALDVFLGR